MAATMQQLRRIEESARRILAGIPGVDFRHALPRTSRQGSGMSGRRAHDRAERGVQMTVFGWTASLHGRVIHQPVIDVDEPDEEIKRFAEQQRRRQSEGFRLGATRPFHLVPPEHLGRPHPPTQVEHLQCDRAVLEILLERHAGDPKPVTDLLCRIVHHKEGHDLGIAAIGLGTLSRQNITPHIQFDGAEMEGSVLTIHAKLPETLVAHAVGRRVGEIAAIHPALDGRIIRRATATDADQSLNGMDTILLGLKPDNIRISERLSPQKGPSHG